MTGDMELLRREAGAHGIQLDDGMLERFSLYRDFLLDWNEKINLTAITDPDGIAVKHFLDSLLVFRACSLPEGAGVIDVGTGAGFPGIPMKILRPDLQLTLLDSLRKRLGFLQELSQALEQNNRLLHGRAEQLGRDPEHREQYDFATARAVAPLPVLLEYCMPYVKAGGCFVALKGPGAGEEIAQSANALRLLGGKAAVVEDLSLPGGYRRTIVLYKKVSHTPSKYPRISVKIAKAPL